MTIENVARLELDPEYADDTCTVLAIDVLLKHRSVPDRLYTVFHQSHNGEYAYDEGTSWLEYLLDELWAGNRDEPYGFSFCIVDTEDLEAQKEQFHELLEEARQNEWLLLLHDVTNQDHILGGLRPLQKDGQWEVVGEVIEVAAGGVQRGHYIQPNLLFEPGKLTNSVRISEDDLWMAAIRDKDPETSSVDLLSILPPEVLMNF